MENISFVREVLSKPYNDTVDVCLKWMLSIRCCCLCGS